MDPAYAATRWGKKGVRAPAGSGGALPARALWPVRQGEKSKGRGLGRPGHRCRGFAGCTPPLGNRRVTGKMADGAIAVAAWGLLPLVRVTASPSLVHVLVVPEVMVASARLVLAKRCRRAPAELKYQNCSQQQNEYAADQSWRPGGEKRKDFARDMGFRCSPGCAGRL